MIKASILADSINRYNERLTTYLLTYPRFIHSEFMTHRLISRNSASSRAIPITKMIEDVDLEPALPEWWGSKKAGMQSGEPLKDNDFAAVETLWNNARRYILETVGDLDTHGLHKSLANRLLEPWAHITVIASATEWHNFFKLRAHAAAMPEFQVLAFRMLDLYRRSQPDMKPPGYWHIPFKLYQNKDWPEDWRIKIAVARCARVSYLTHDATHPTPEQDIELYHKLKDHGHWSPFEHVAQADPGTTWGNFKGWKQHRKDFEEEAGNDVDLEKVWNSKPEWITL